MGEPFVRPALPEDAKSLAPRLRLADWQELNATGLDPEKTLREAVDQNSLSIVLDGTVEGMFGCVPYEGDETIGVPWLLGSNAMKRDPIRRKFLRQSKAWLKAMHEIYPTLINAVSETNTLHLRWLEWLGFDTSTTIENYAGSGLTFRLVLSRKGHSDV